MVSYRAQRGVSLIISIIILGAMMLSGIAMFRKLSAGSMIAGNLAFTNSAIAGGDAGAEAARAWLLSQTGLNLQANGAAGTAYYAASCYNNLLVAGDCNTGLANSFDPQTHNWAGDSVTLAPDQAGNTVQYVIHRLCNVAGQATSTGCVVALSTGGGSGGHATIGYGQQQLQTVLNPYYRITTRISGPRNAVAFTQVTMF